MSASAGVPATARGARLSPAAIAAALAAAALVAWVVTVDRMAGMDAGPGTDLGRLGWFTGVWATMMAAMMLPSATPAVLLFAGAGARGARGGARGVAPTAAFVAGYLAVWVAFGLVAFGLYRAIAAWDPGFLAWDDGGPWVAGGAVVLAGLYQLTPLKTICLRHCRSPLHFLLARWRPGASGAFRMGAEHGLFCAGCCGALMLVLFAVGVMSIFWMAVVAAVVFAEKVLPGGERLARGLALALVALGVWIAVAPGSVPNLTEPGAMASDMPSTMPREKPGGTDMPSTMPGEKPAGTDKPSMMPGANPAGTHMDG